MPLPKLPKRAPKTAPVGVKMSRSARDTLDALIDRSNMDGAAVIEYLLHEESARKDKLAFQEPLPRPVSVTLRVSEAARDTLRALQKKYAGQSQADILEALLFREYNEGAKAKKP